MNHYQTLLTHLKEGILTITFNRPEKLNALNETLLNELSDVLTVATQDDAVKALLITGQGKAFCAGVDIQRLVDLDAVSGFEFAQKGQSVLQQLEDLKKPTLAAINGIAFGGGCELAMSTTIRIASEKASFAQPEVKLGLMPGYGGTQRLSRLIGPGRALDLIITGRSISAQEAANYGLVSQVILQEDLLNQAETILKNIITMAPLAIQSAIEAVKRGYDLPIRDAILLEATYFGLLCSSKDKAEGVQSFLNKRTPQFTGQ